MTSNNVKTTKLQIKLEIFDKNTKFLPWVKRVLLVSNTLVQQNSSRKLRTISLDVLFADLQWHFRLVLHRLCSNAGRSLLSHLRLVLLCYRRNIIKIPKTNFHF